MPRSDGVTSDSNLAGIRETARLAAIAATVQNDRHVKAATVQAKKEATAAAVKAKRDAEASRLQAERDAGAATLKAKRDAKAAELQASRDALAASVKYGRDRTVAEEAARNDADKSYYQSMLDAAKGSIDRARSAAQLVQQAAAAVGTICAGILGLVFSVSGRLLPIRGVIPALFLGFSIGLSTVFIAFMSSGKRIEVDPSG